MSNKIRYKLLNQKLQSHINYQWVLNEWKHTSGEGNLCTSGWLHCYTHPLLAILLNSIHGNIDNPLLFKCEVKGKPLNDKGLKEGWNNMKIVEQIDIPVITNIQKVAFAILCAKEVCKNRKWNIWADNWLNNVDRPQLPNLNTAYSHAAQAAYYAAYYYAAYFIACNASYAAYYVANAAYAAVNYNPINLIKLANQSLKCV